MILKAKKVGNLIHVTVYSDEGVEEVTAVSDDVNDALHIIGESYTLTSLNIAQLMEYLGVSFIPVPYYNHDQLEVLADLNKKWEEEHE